MREDGTTGVLFDEFVPFALTLEPPWKNNKPNESCVPKGEYICNRFHSEKHPDTFCLSDTSGREAILFHIGNSFEDTQGCILIGRRFGIINNKIAILESKLAFDEFLNRTKDIEQFNLLIQEI